MRHRRAAAAAALLIAAILSGCTNPAKTPDVDLAAVQERIVAVDGVVDAEMGVRNTGVPGSYGVSAEVVIDDHGLAEIGTVVESVVREFAEAPGYTEYGVTVAHVDPAEQTGRIILTLSDYADQIPIDEGYLSSSLTLTADELQAVLRG